MKEDLYWLFKREIAYVSFKEKNIIYFERDQLGAGYFLSIGNEEERCVASIDEAFQEIENLFGAAILKDITYVSLNHGYISLKDGYYCVYDNVMGLSDVFYTFDEAFEHAFQVWKERKQ